MLTVSTLVLLGTNNKLIRNLAKGFHILYTLVFFLVTVYKKTDLLKNIDLNLDLLFIFILTKLFIQNIDISWRKKRVRIVREVYYGVNRRTSVIINKVGTIRLFQIKV